MENINLNDKVPNFELEGTNNLSFNLSSFLGKYIVIYFYPKIQHQAVPMKVSISPKILASLKN